MVFVRICQLKCGKFNRTVVHHELFYIHKEITMIRFTVYKRKMLQMEHPYMLSDSVDDWNKFEV